LLKSAFVIIQYILLVGWWETQHFYCFVSQWKKVVRLQKNQLVISPILVKVVAFPTSINKKSPPLV